MYNLHLQSIIVMGLVKIGDEIMWLSLIFVGVYITD